LVLVLQNLIVTKGDFTGAFGKVWPFLAYVQTGAVLEVVHALLGLVKSPVSTTVVQVASRLMLCWGILELFPNPEVRSTIYFTTMTISWCVTESVRYLYYGLNLVGSNPSALVWARYTFFFVLYPTGAGSEAVEIYLSLPFAKKWEVNYYWFLIVVLLTYIPGFATMYGHMIGQRKKYLSGQKKAKKIE